MSPNKREASPSADDVCKKLKVDLVSKDKEQQESITKTKQSVTTDDDSNHNHSNNNKDDDKSNNNSSSGSNNNNNVVTPTDTKNGVSIKNDAKETDEKQQQSDHNKDEQKLSEQTENDKSSSSSAATQQQQQANGSKNLEQEKEKTGGEDEEATAKKDEANANATKEQQEQKVKEEEKEETAKQPNNDSSNGGASQSMAADSKQESEQQPSTGSSSQTTTTTSEPPKPEEEPTGTLLICGGANWDMTGRKELPKTAKKPVEVHPAARNLWAPHRVCLDTSAPDKSLRVKGVFSGCNACHSVIVTDEGVPLTFGRNDKGQLGLGDTETRFVPTVVEALKGKNVVAAACGRSHTLFLTSDGVVYGCGDNKMGQCGTNQPSVQQITTPTKISFKENKPVVKLACGAEFSLIVDIEGALYSFGHPEHGQLGHNSEGKYFTTGNKYAFHCEHSPRRIVAFIEKSRDGHVSALDDVKIVDIACGTNHSLAVDKNHRCFSWGFGGYHRLGHSETKNEFVPRSIRVFDVPNSHGRGAARVFAGATHSMATDVNGLLYFWGQNKSSGEATMYPKNVQDLCGWRIRSVACANRSIVLAADESVVSWGPSPTYGELGYGEGKSKSSTTPQEVRPLDGIHVLNVVCGFGHTLMIARDKSSEEASRINKLRKWP